MIAYREMSNFDIPELVGIEKEIFPESPWSAAQFREELAGVPRTRKYLVAHENGKIIGYAGIALAGDIADIHNIAVIPSHRERRQRFPRVVSGILARCHLLLLE